MLHLQKLEVLYRERLFLDIPEELKRSAWARSHQHTSDAARIRAYLSYLCGRVLQSWLLEWLEAEQWESLDARASTPRVRLFKEDSLESIWEFMTGVAIEIGDRRWLAVPDDSGESDRLCIPQEWVDIPDWQADYYLGVQMDVSTPDASWLCVWGYADRHTLKQHSEYRERDRTYLCNRTNLREDLAIALNAEPFSNVERDPNPKLPATPSEGLLPAPSELAGASEPRLAIAFHQWQELVADDCWRQQFYQQRLGGDRRIVVEEIALPLSKWTQAAIAWGWRAAETLLPPKPQWRYNYRTPTNARQDPIQLQQVEKARAIFIDPIGERVALIVKYVPTASAELEISVALRVLDRERYLPSDLSLEIQDEFGEVLMQTKARQSKYLACSFGGEIGDRFNVRVSWRDCYSLTSKFSI